MSADPLSQTFAALADPTRRAILARLCSGEATVSELAEPFDEPLFTPATKAAIGGTMTTTLSTVLRAPNDIHTARQTSTLQSTARKNSCNVGSAAFAEAIAIYALVITFIL